ncbi:MAG TPA: MotA/TolQ/ExbB proton channel family protein [bacterium]|nr:MotA/TolQ/ExbB proton channel family protein [bacterium]HOL35981.1 MotA/TolQ/ExbB proton channel family protein [bacterium]HPP08951.1 MotA/TolQ/ExbB proton channel family protein [bacterium]
MSLWQFTVRGGYLMIPIIICGALTLAVIIERLIALKRSETDAEKFISRIEEKLKKRKIREAIEICESTPGPVSQLVHTALIKSDRPPEIIRENIQDEANHIIPYLEKYLGVLATIATIAPLLGLLGTVTGLIKAFMVIEAKAGLVNPGDLARGIWEALITTVAGLVVSIPAYLGYNYLVSRVNGLINDMERATSRMMDILIFLHSEEEEIK